MIGRPPPFFDTLRGLARERFELGERRAFDRLDVSARELDARQRRVSASECEQRRAAVNNEEVLAGKQAKTRVHRGAQAKDYNVRSLLGSEPDKQKLSALIASVLLSTPHLRPDQGDEAPPTQVVPGHRKS